MVAVGDERPNSFNVEGPHPTPTSHPPATRNKSVLPPTRILQSRLWFLLQMISNRPFSSPKSSDTLILFRLHILPRPVPLPHCASSLPSYPPTLPFHPTHTHTHTRTECVARENGGDAVRGGRQIELQLLRQMFQQRALQLLRLLVADRDRQRLDSGPDDLMYA